MNRRRFLAALGSATAATAALAIDAFAVEPRRVTVTRHAIGAGPDGPTLRLVQLADLHLQEIGDHERRVAREVGSLAPHLVLFTGDSIDRKDRLEVLGAFLDLLEPAIPKIATLGNWERWAGIDSAELARVYQKRNARLLVNETATHVHEGRSFRLTGLDDAVSGSPDLDAALAGIPAGPDHVLLQHAPAYRDTLIGSSRPPPVMLSGHTHGGQVALFGWAPVRPRGSGRYVSGWYRDARPELYVSRGIGTVIVPVRLGAPPEIAVFDWRLSGDEAR
jgi:hypothetical protein